MLCIKKFNDNDGLQKVSGDTLTFFLGDGARANIGGKLEAMVQRMLMLFLRPSLSQIL